VQLSISDNVNVHKNKETKKTLVQIEKDNHDNVIVIDDDNEDKQCETDYSAWLSLAASFIQEYFYIGQQTPDL
jgi:hypothetical protein